MAGLPVWNKTVIGYSTKGRPIERYALAGGADGRGAYIVCRQHAGESAASWLLDGFLRCIAGLAGKQADHGKSIYVVPFVDVDGVAEGCYGKDQMLGDMNRAWYTPFPSRTEIAAVIQDIRRWSQNCHPAYFFDMHSPAHEVQGLMVNVYDDAGEKPLLETAQFLEKVNEIAGDLPGAPFRQVHVESGTVGSSQGARGTSHEYIHTRLGIPAMTMEVSYHGSAVGDVFTQADYQAWGHAVARTLWDNL